MNDAGADVARAANNDRIRSAIMWVHESFLCKWVCSRFVLGMPPEREADGGAGEGKRTADDEEGAVVRRALGNAIHRFGPGMEVVPTVSGTDGQERLFCL